MMTNENLAFCPFCTDHGTRSILCESLLPGNLMVQSFTSPRKKELWFAAVCCDERCARRCPAAAALYALTEEDTSLPLKITLLEPEYREKVKSAFLKAARGTDPRALRRGAP